MSSGYGAASRVSCLRHGGPSGPPLFLGMGSRGGGGGGGGVFCKNCPFPSRALPNPEKLLSGAGRQSPSLPGGCWRSFMTGKGKKGGGGSLYPWGQEQALRLPRDGREQQAGKGMQGGKGERRWRTMIKGDGRPLGRSPAVTYRYVTFSPFADDDGDVVSVSDGDVPSRPEKKFSGEEGMQGRGPFLRKLFPPRARPAPLRALATLFLRIYPDKKETS